MPICFDPTKSSLYYRKHILADARHHTHQLRYQTLYANALCITTHRLVSGLSTDHTSWCVTRGMHAAAPHSKPIEVHLAQSSERMALNLVRPRGSSVAAGRNLLPPQETPPSPIVCIPHLLSPMPPAEDNVQQKTRDLLIAATSTSTVHELIEDGTT